MSFGAGDYPILTVVIVLVVSFLIWTWPSSLSDIPGPGRDVPYLGGMPVLLKNKDRIPDFLVEGMHTYGGKTWGMPMSNAGMIKKAVIVLTTPEAVLHVLKSNFANYVKGQGFHDGAYEMLGDGIFAVDGAGWKLHRKVASQMFSNRLLKESTTVVARHGAALVAHFHTLSAPSGDAPAAIDLQDMFFRLTMDIFSFIAFGEEIGSLTRATPHAFAKAFDEIQYWIQKRFFNPIYPIARRFGLSHGERRIAECVRVIDAFATRIIAARRREASAGAENLGPDLLSRFLDDSAKKAAEEAAAGAGAGPTEVSMGGSDKELRDIVINFIMAGRDTTACTLSWLFYELAKRPDVQAKLRAEFQAVVSSAAAGAPEATYDQANQLTYAHAVVAEVLRLHPSVPKQTKSAVKADTLPCGAKVPAGASVFYSAYAMGRDARLWPDPLAFRPERFLKDATGGGAALAEPAAGYMAFHAGPRLCIGKPLAMMEIKLVANIVLAAFDFELAEPHAGGYASTFVMLMRPGLKVFLTPR